VIVALTLARWTHIFLVSGHGISRGHMHLVLLFGVRSLSSFWRSLKTRIHIYTHVYAHAYTHTRTHAYTRIHTHDICSYTRAFNCQKLDWYYKWEHILGMCDCVIRYLGNVCVCLCYQVSGELVIARLLCRFANEYWCALLGIAFTHTLNSPCNLRGSVVCPHQIWGESFQRWVNA
jgi:hypothetical protein